ncbi:VOC family protein [Peribacillus kribbensis]|uniref:VOC family protein n=1 Tax=Peribacillus kribbensis TaxID=356658 RepID=UPI0003F4D83E|nr:VOC family protein [Peribacillus kribbensis]
MSFHDKNIYVKHIQLRVKELPRSLTFYQEKLGLRVLREEKGRAELTADGRVPLLSLIEVKDAEPKMARTTGLYHFALLVPSRAELGKMLRNLLQTGYPLQGASDHSVSEAVYLADPDGNGIEIYTDRKSQEWKWDSGEVMMVTEPMDAEGVLLAGKDLEWNGISPDTIMGHIHLHVADLEEARKFYCDMLGFKIVSTYGGHALFISTEGYHHHIGLNTWNGVGAPKPSSRSIGMEAFVLSIPDQNTLEAIESRLQKNGYEYMKENGLLKTDDPSGNSLVLSVSND